MYLTKVILKDYGVYQGKNEFDFTCTQEKPIILIGGTNGAGKTTLFESVMLCLYGMQTLGKRVTKKTYEKFLAKKIHRYLGSATSADFASIIVEFQFFHDGKITEYQVDRTWRNEDGKILEQLSIKKKDNSNSDFKSLDTIEESYWQSFVEELIPRGIAKLFFFDGEKIVEMADEGNEDIAIKSSFSSLLGLDLVEQLRSDLQINLMRNLTGNEKYLEIEFERLSKEKRRMEDKINSLKEKNALKESHLDEIRSEISEFESQIAKLGGEFAENREKLKSDRAVNLLNIENISKRINDLCLDVLPFSLIPKQLSEVKDQINKDQEAIKRKFAKDILSNNFKNLSSEIKSEEFWNGFDFNDQTKQKLVSKILSILSYPKQNSSENKELFHFSSMQHNKILEIIENANDVILSKLEKETRQYQKVRERLDVIDTALINAPKDDEIGPLISKLNEKHSLAGRLQAEIDHVDQEISGQISLIRHKNVEIRDVVSQRYKNKKSQQKADLTEKIQIVLDEYVEKLKTRKIQLLENYLLEAIHILMHKQNFIDKVSIDKTTFEITLYRKNNDPMPKDLLSKGEQQMFATAVLWALAKTSGKPLPFMIDTPLARLDEEHRVNLIEKFFPIASHQVMIFSTDSEIDYEKYRKLLPFMTRAYSMQFLPEEGKTKQHSDYFWNKKGERVVEI
ncbi:MAG: DNA sulfur modification protein DndD [Nitrosopumilus sp.]|uniref:DNA sulfur modification protein DndD n=1 Tax=Nitrosopumilus sp. TaxID=2024843 RepID=UPI00242C98D8|nr:DNA sulfur modification protein DndD [Nitrosopumilus sp.]MCV0366393.1 DNA sulfur modification protein DndD [Nitrosopumilus sp.]